MASIEPTTTRDAETRVNTDNDMSDPNPSGPPAAGPGPFVFGPVLKLEGESEDAFEARAVALREAQLREYYFRLITEGPFAAILKDLAEQQYEAAVKRSHYHLVMKLERLCEMRDQTYVMEAPNATVTWTPGWPRVAWRATGKARARRCAWRRARSSVSVILCASSRRGAGRSRTSRVSSTSTASSMTQGKWSWREHWV